MGDRAITRLNSGNRDSYGDHDIAHGAHENPVRVQSEHSKVNRGRRKVLAAPRGNTPRRVAWKRSVFMYISRIIRCQGRVTGTLNISQPSTECRAAAPDAVRRRDRGGDTAFGAFRSFLVARRPTRLARRGIIPSLFARARRGIIPSLFARSHPG